MADQQAAELDQHNAISELLELASSRQCDPPTFTLLPSLGEQQFQFACSIQLTDSGEPHAATGEVRGKKKDAQQSAAAACLRSLASQLAPALEALTTMAPDFEVPPREASPAAGPSSCLVSTLNLLCQSRGWRIPL
jgi:hypothetical protein